MAFRNVYVQNNVRIKVENEQLVIETKEDNFMIPLEDINSICIESLMTNISSYALKKFVEHDIVLYICDEKHLPTGFLLGCNNYSRQLKNLNIQFNLPKPLKKRIWQDIIKVKIRNQSQCLKELGIKDVRLDNMINKVTSGDISNVEAKAASQYFKDLFGKDFNRDLECVQNGALNYGYAIVRGMIARTLVMYGFEPALGIFHHNQLNNFNLADDFIECFRPIVDLYVLKNLDFTNEELTPSIKRNIYNVINCLVLIDGKKFNVQGAIEYMVKSFSTSVYKNENLMKLPYLISIETYKYV